MGRAGDRVCGGWETRQTEEWLGCPGEGEAEQTCKPHSVESRHLSWDPDCSGPLCALPGNLLTSEQNGPLRFPAWACSRKSLAFSLRLYPALVSVPLVLASRRTGVTRYLCPVECGLSSRVTRRLGLLGGGTLTTEVVAGKAERGRITNSCSCERVSRPLDRSPRPAVASTGQSVVSDGGYP